jgi:hypothetical protein
MPWWKTDLNTFHSSDPTYWPIRSSTSCYQPLVNTTYQSRMTSRERRVRRSLFVRCCVIDDETLVVVIYRAGLQFYIKRGRTRWIMKDSGLRSSAVVFKDRPLGSSYLDASKKMCLRNDVHEVYGHLCDHAPPKLICLSFLWWTNPAGSCGVLTS